MIIHECDQRTEEWHALRLGRITGTGFSKVLAKGQGKTRKSYMLQLAAERLTGESEDSYINEDMKRGMELEDEAFEFYEGVNLTPVQKVGFVERDEWIGVSPDGLIGDDGLLELKCPRSTTHLTNIMDNRMPPTYKAQVQGQIWVCEKEWCDFTSYDPRVKDKKMFTFRVFRDDNYLDNLEKECYTFVNELKEMIERIKNENN